MTSVDIVSLETRLDDFKANLLETFAAASEVHARCRVGPEADAEAERLCRAFDVIEVLPPVMLARRFFGSLAPISRGRRDLALCLEPMMRRDVAYFRRDASRIYGAVIGDSEEKDSNLSVILQLLGESGAGEDDIAMIMDGLVEMVVGGCKAALLSPDFARNISFTTAEARSLLRIGNRE